MWCHKQALTNKLTVSLASQPCHDDGLARMQVVFRLIEHYAVGDSNTSWVISMPLAKPFFLR
ncbi:hypothetical protein [Sodalis-like endosymbiont of Proechinophthirus fluctus]|uniref:hypothetical protein n=1 Tax=Sodalis-like endosymbiont of Proechinophthirus fluctus TaxID=1462730 RepID=UPI000829FD0A|nr:hypothetical protein [Sodalis-like endosymbiont of Proechinophthirus fluctus]